MLVPMAGSEYWGPRGSGGSATRGHWLSTFGSRCSRQAVGEAAMALLRVRATGRASGRDGAKGANVYDLLIARSSRPPSSTALRPSKPWGWRSSGQVPVSGARPGSSGVASSQPGGGSSKGTTVRMRPSRNSISCQKLDFETSMWVDA